MAADTAVNNAADAVISVHIETVPGHCIHFTLFNEIAQYKMIHVS